MLRRSNDFDLVSWPECSKNRQGRPNPSSKPDPIREDWKPLRIETNNDHPHDHPHIPASVNGSNAMELC